MRDVLKTLKAGDEVKVEIERDGKRKVLTVVTTAPEPDLAMAPPPGMIEEWLHDEDFEKYGGPMAGMPMFHFRGPAIRGLELCKLDEDLGSYFKTTDGVLVIKAPRGGALSLKSGDVIQKIDGDAVTEPITVLDKLRSRGDEQSVKLEIVRQGRKMELEGRIPVAEASPRFRVMPVRPVPPVPPVPPSRPRDHDKDDDGS
jgi:PDZ domain-containing secreted protein